MITYYFDIFSTEVLIVYFYNHIKYENQYILYTIKEFIKSQNW